MLGPTRAELEAENLATLQQAIWRNLVVVIPQDPNKPNESPYFLTSYGKQLDIEMGRGNN